MNFGDLFDALARRESVRHETLVLPESADAPPAPAEGYFEIRLAEMYLTDDRRWLKEITPAALVIGEYTYNGSRIQRPCFISSKLLGEVTGDIDTKNLRVKFTDTAMIGPTPYQGGDVNLFAGLFQASTEDKLTAMFGIFEKLFRQFGGGAVAAGVAMAGELLPAVLKLLGSSEISCLVAERRPIARRGLPANFHLAYLRGTARGALDTQGLHVANGQLKRHTSDGLTTAVSDIDYCLIEVRCCATHDDYTLLPFHQAWLKARDLAAEGRKSEAQAELLACARQIMHSPDLTESHKIVLIKSYQAKLLSVPSLLDLIPQEQASRAGKQSGAELMRQQLRDSGEFDAKDLVKELTSIAQLAVKLDAGDFKETLNRELADARPGATAAETANLLRTLTLGSIAQ